MLTALLSWLRALFAPRNPTPPATPTRPLPPNPRLFRVHVARSLSEWESAGNAGLGAKYCPDDGRYREGAHVQFNADAFPRSRSYAGSFSTSDTLAAARLQDKLERRPPNRLIEDIILHEVAGHHILGVGADHNSTNTLMNERNGPKTERDRQALRDTLASTFDGFSVHLGLPPPLF